MADDSKKKPLSDEEALKQKVDSYMKPPRASESKSAEKMVDSGEAIHNIPVTINKNNLPKPEDLPLPSTAPPVPGAKKVTEPVPAKPAESEPSKPGSTVTPSEPERAETKTEDKAEKAPDIPEDDGLATPENDKAVDDIAAKESDLVLAVDDAKAAKSAKTVEPKHGFKAKFKALFKSKWTWLVLLLLLVAVFAVPFTRYKVLGLVIKKPVTVTVLDSKTASPVSGADVKLGSASGKTESDGKVTIKAGLGPRNLEVSKGYYETSNQTYTVKFGSDQKADVKLVATGRLVPISVHNSITKKPVSGASIKILNTTAKTDSKGKATVALPVGKQTYDAVITQNDYNQTGVKVQVTDRAVKANDFPLTPSGQVYFLSNKSGAIDVVKSNLDGSDRKVVLAGTGREDSQTTSLLASRDWRYLVLKAQRESDRPALYLIDTKTGKSTQFDSGAADFNLIGWHDHYFVYSLTRSNHNVWEQGGQAIKSYDASRQQLNILDQTQAQGTNASYTTQSFSNYYLLDDGVVYATQWHGYNADTSNLTATIRSVKPNGQSKKDYQSLPTATIGSVQAVLYEPQSVYFAFYNYSNSTYSYYEFEDLAVRPASGIDQSAFLKDYPTYLISPSGNKTFWTELRDGKNSLFVGDSNGKNGKQIAENSEYAPYGWYGDDYVLVSKNESELYVMPVAGLAEDQTPLKVTDYYKPVITYRGYGYGYGGL